MRPIEFRPARRMTAIGVSEILQVMKLAADLRREGRDIIDVSAGEPDFDTPDPVKAAAADAMRLGATKYTALDGLPELKDAIRAKFRRDYDLDYRPSEIIAAAGAKQVLFNALMASLDPGDEVIIPAPYWTSYKDMIVIAEGKAVIVTCPAEQGFLLTPDALEAAITDRTRWVLLNSPSNPTGATYSRSDYEALLDVLRRYPNVWILADDIYEHLVYDGAEFVSPVMVGGDFRDRTLIINGVSKAYAMTGWRIGYGCGPAALIKSMVTVQSQATSCPCSLSQHAAIEALTGSQDVVAERCQLFEDRRDFIVDLLNRIDGIFCTPPRGAFYIYANCGDIIGSRTAAGSTIGTDTDFAEFLLQEANVAVVPGAPFGLSPYVRLSFAASRARLEDACGRIERACESLEVERTGA